MPLDPAQLALDPQAKAILDMIASADRIPYGQITPVQARAQFAELCRRTRKHDSWPVLTREQAIPGPAGQLKTRMFLPQKNTEVEHGALVYFHGGGWCIGDLDTHDAVCRQLAS